ncbi:GtrA family protein [Luteipulveratus sp. YIM 133132]|uniref:GtrA family protein n=1 Tax=Luteipulveratus flavus TaxID=3031728 RepID=UPI0023B041EA|nr:GtrA family protein [Luteipulveratus sp. YIM 133132]MDE9364677.1 GtrA family protein [Luteipulveratus sp. YIM 133132]
MPGPANLLSRRLGGEMLRFAVVGVGSTALSVALFALFASVTTHQWANVLALLLSTVANTAVNRRFTFGVQGRTGAVRVQLQSLLLLGVSWALTALALWLLNRAAPDAGTWVAAAVFLVGNAVATVVRFWLLRRWFRPGAHPASPDHQQAESVLESLPMSAHWERSGEGANPARTD